MLGWSSIMCQVSRFRVTDALEFVHNLSNQQITWKDFWNKLQQAKTVKDTHWPAPGSSENMWEGTILSMPNTYHDRNEKTSGWCPSNWLLAATDAILSCLALCNLSRPCYPPWAIVTFMLPKILLPVSGFGPLKRVWVWSVVLESCLLQCSSR